MAYDFMADMSAKIKQKNNPTSAFNVPMNSATSAAVTQTNTEQAAPASASAPMSVYDWQQTTENQPAIASPDAVNLGYRHGLKGPANQTPERWQDAMTPTGYGVPGVPRGEFGLKDVYGRVIGENGVANSIAQKPDPTVNEDDSYTGPSNAGNDAQIYAKKAVEAQKHYGNKDEGMAEWARLHPELAAKAEKKSFNPLMQSTFGYQTGQAPDQIAARNAEKSQSRTDRGLSGIGPVADGMEYATDLATQGTSGVGPLADGAVYADMLGNQEARTNSQGVQQQGMNMSWKDSTNAPRFVDTPTDNGSSNATYGVNTEEKKKGLMDFLAEYESSTQPGTYPSNFGGFQQ